MTTSATTLTIPEELKPADGRFGCGPSKVRPEQLAVRTARQMDYDWRRSPSCTGINSVRPSIPASSIRLRARPSESGEP